MITLHRRLLAAIALAPCALGAQQQQTPPTPQQPAMPRVAASTYATVSVALNGHYVGTQWFPQAAGIAGPSRIEIAYGQPHLRGRAMLGTASVPMDSVWRLGANLATRLTADVGVTIGGSYIPPGVYSLYVLPRRTGAWQLIVNRQFGQWGTEYDQAQDVARIDMRARSLTEPVESLSIYLVPNVLPQGSPPIMPSGTLRIVWEKTDLSADWRVGR